MQGVRTLPAVYRNWWLPFALAVFLIQLAFAAQVARNTFLSPDGIDYRVLVTAGQRLLDGANPYATDVDGVLYRWHPLAGVFFAAIAPLGVWAWRLINLASLALLRDWRLIAV